MTGLPRSFVATLDELLALLRGELLRGKLILKVLSETEKKVFVVEVDFSVFFYYLFKQLLSSRKPQQTY
jgi:hypothetical protein